MIFFQGNPVPPTNWKSMRTIIGVIAFSIVFGCNSKHQAPTATGVTPLKALGNAPEFEVEGISGTKLSSKELKGKVVVVDFWATWCQPCIQEIPHLNKLNQELTGTNTRILGMTFESGSLDDARPKIGKLGIRYPVFMGNDAVEDGFGGYLGLPTTFIIGKDWKVYRKYLGFTPNKEQLIKQDIEVLLQRSS